MKKFYLACFLLFLGILAQAQNQKFDVKSFKLLPNDLTAMSQRWKKYDRNGEVAAIIKMVTTETGFTFDGGTLGIVHSEQRNGEVWIWVPATSRKITISHQQLGVLREKPYPIEIEAGRTYEMILEITDATPYSNPDVPSSSSKQHLVFQINPPDARLEVNDTMWRVTDGVASKFVDFGSYSYRVQAPDYHTEAGRVIVNNPLDKTIIKVNLKPNFGWVEVSGKTTEGADVYIDDAYISKAPCKSNRLKSGTHTVQIIKDLYEPYTIEVTVSDEQTFTLTPELKADYSRITLTVDADAEIWVNDVRKGTRTWTGNLATGNYKIECRMASHETTETIKKIDSRMNGQTIRLEAPHPIYGMLNVESSPNLSKIYLDGKGVGETPCYFPEILIGQHSLRLTKDGYNDYTETITIAKGDRKQVNATLNRKVITSQNNVSSPVADNNKKTLKRRHLRFAYVPSISIGNCGNVDLGCGLGGINNIVGWHLGFDGRVVGDGGNDRVISVLIGGGPAFRIYADRSVRNAVVWNWGINGGFNCLESNTNKDGFCAILNTRLLYFHVGEERHSGLGLSFEYFWGYFVFGYAQGWGVGLSFSFLDDHMH